MSYQLNHQSKQIFKSTYFKINNRNQNNVSQLPETMMVCSSPQEMHTTLSSRNQNFPGTLSLNLHLPNVNTAPVSVNNNIIITISYDASGIMKTFMQIDTCHRYMHRMKAKRCISLALLMHWPISLVARYRQNVRLRTSPLPTSNRKTVQCEKYASTLIMH